MKSFYAWGWCCGVEGVVELSGEPNTGCARDSGDITPSSEMTAEAQEQGVGPQVTDGEITPAPLGHEVETDVLFVESCVGEVIMEDEPLIDERSEPLGVVDVVRRQELHNGIARPIQVEYVTPDGQSAIGLFVEDEHHADEACLSDVDVVAFDGELQVAGDHAGLEADSRSSIDALSDEVQSRDSGTSSSIVDEGVVEESIDEFSFLIG